MQPSSLPREGGLREAKKRATRKQLTSVARRLTLEHGLDAITVESICAEVGVSVRTFFNYFASKDESVVGQPIPIGNQQTQEVFLTGGPSGNLLPDLVTLLDPTDAIEPEDRDEFRQSFALFAREPRILALELSRAFQHEQDLAALIGERRQLATPDEFCNMAAAIAQTVLRRGLIGWIDADDDQPLRVHIRLAAGSAASVLDPTTTA